MMERSSIIALLSMGLGSAVGNSLDLGDCEYMGGVNHFGTVRLERRRRRRRRKRRLRDGGDEAERKGGGTDSAEAGRDKR